MPAEVGNGVKRCTWADSSERMRQYHDHVWGKPEHDDHQLFKKLILDGFQAGLSWAIILNKQDSLSEAFDDFKPEIVATYDDRKIQELLTNPGIIRHRGKINAAVSNAKMYHRLCETYGSLDEFLWRYVDNKPILNEWADDSEVPSSTALSDEISKQLKKEGFKFVGTTIVYAYMQAIGMVNDHLVSCSYRTPKL